MRFTEEQELRAAIYAFIRYVGGIGADRLQRIFEKAFPSCPPERFVESALGRKRSEVGGGTDYGMWARRLWITQSYLRLLGLRTDEFGPRRSFQNKVASLSSQQLADYVEGRRGPDAADRQFLARRIKVPFDQLPVRLPVTIEIGDGLVWFSLSADVSSLGRRLTGGKGRRLSKVGHRTAEHVELAQLSPDVLRVAAFIALAAEDDEAAEDAPLRAEPYRVSEATVYALSAGNVRDALLELSRRACIRRIGDEIAISPYALDAVLHHVRRGEPHDSLRIRAIEYACANITDVAPEEGRRVLARMRASLALDEHTAPEESKSVARRLTRQLAHLVAIAQTRVTPAAWSDYAFAAVALAQNGAFEEAVQVLRRHAAAREHRNGNNDETFARSLVMACAIEAGNREAFAACLRDGIALFLLRRGATHFAVPLLDRSLRHGIQVAIASGWLPLVASTLEDVIASVVPSEGEATAEAVRALLSMTTEPMQSVPMT